MPIRSIQSAELVDANNYVSIAGKLGWTVAGAVVLGPLGALVGAIGGGNRSERIVAVRFTDGRKAMLSGRTQDLQPILAAGFNMKDAPPPEPPTIVIAAQPESLSQPSQSQPLAAPSMQPWSAAPSRETATLRPDVSDAVCDKSARKPSGIGSGIAVVIGLIFLSVFTIGLNSFEPLPSIATICVIVWAMTWMKRSFLGVSRVALMVTGALCLALKCLSLLAWAVTA